MKHVVSRYHYLAISGLLVAVLMLIGAGCSRSTAPTDNFPEFITLPREAGVVSAFSGSEGAATEVTFDALAKGYNVYLVKKGLAGGNNGTFLGFLATDGKELASMDAYGNTIQLTEIDIDSYLLHSAGPDTFPETVDDYYKAYQD